MKIWIVSDLHAESMRGWDLPSGAARPDFDLMVCAGDIHTRFERTVAWLRERVTDRPVIVVAGNHEFWGVDFDITIEKARAAATDTNVFVLERDSISIDGVTFLGGTGWTDFNLFGDPPLAMAAALNGMNDYRKIRKSAYAEKLRPIDTLRRHEATRAFITSELAKAPAAGERRVVVTHHCPFPGFSNSNSSEIDLIDACYGSDMTDLMVRPVDCPTGAAINPADVWIFGHTHRSCDRIFGSTRLISNPKGYGPGLHGRSWENKEFDPNFILEI